VKAEDVMLSDFSAVAARAPMRDVAVTILRDPAGAALVLDERGAVIGLISESMLAGIVDLVVEPHPPVVEPLPTQEPDAR
jgi:hypothetical protein